MTKFRAFQIDKKDNQIIGALKALNISDLCEGDVTIKVTHSTINYKDALAATGTGKILRKFPLIGGIDLAGEVTSSSVDEIKIGDRVLVNGCGLSETRDGGYAEIARVHKDAIIHIPNNMNAHQVMQIGTAGYTAALAINNMEHNGQTPEAGPILVTGATGGVGSMAINMLASKGYEVVALTSKTDKFNYLENICEIINNNNGGMLIFDYGYLEPKMHETLQAINNHKYSNVLENIGNSDITYNISFNLFKRFIERFHDLDVIINNQKKFLTSMGILQRAEIISKNIPFSKKTDLFYRVRRLIDEKQMGELFKVMLIKKSDNKFDTGFQDD